MAAAIYPAGITETHGDTLALTTTENYWNIPEGFRQGMVYAPAEDFRMHLNPPIDAVYYYDASNNTGERWERAGSSGAPITLERDLTDENAGTGTGTAMAIGTSSDALWVSIPKPIRGLRVVIGAANDQTRTLTVKYWNGTTLATIGANDGTKNGGNTTFAQTGNIIWSVPSDWARATLQVIGATGSGEGDAPGFAGLWLEFTWSGNLGTNTELTQLYTMNADTDYGYFRLGTEYIISTDRRYVGTLEVDLASGSDTMQITVWRTGG